MFIGMKAVGINGKTWLITEVLQRDTMRNRGEEDTDGYKEICQSITDKVVWIRHIIKKVANRDYWGYDKNTLRQTYTTLV